MTKRERSIRKKAYARCARVADGYRDQLIAMAQPLKGVNKRGPVAAAEACRVLREVFLEFKYEG